MSVSVYYSLIRKEPLTESERAGIEEVLTRFDVDKYNDIEDADEKPGKWGWLSGKKKTKTPELSLGETFTFYDQPYQPGEVLAGSTKLPVNEDVLFDAALYWGALLGEVAAVIEGGEWDVRIDDQEMPQDPDTGAFVFPG